MFAWGPFGRSAGDPCRPGPLPVPQEPEENVPQAHAEEGDLLEQQDEADKEDHHDERAKPRLGLEVDLPGERVSVRGVVRSTHIDRDGLEAVGVQFVEPSPHARGVLTAYCDEQNRRQARAVTAS